MELFELPLFKKKKKNLLHIPLITIRGDKGISHLGASSLGFFESSMFGHLGASSLAFRRISRVSLLESGSDLIVLGRVRINQGRVQIWKSGLY